MDHMIKLLVDYQVREGDKVKIDSKRYGTQIGIIKKIKVVPMNFNRYGEYKRTNSTGASYKKLELILDSKDYGLITILSFNSLENLNNTSRRRVSPYQKYLS